MAIKILVVDDEADILLSVKMLLSRDGYNVTTIDTGKKALDLLNKDKFDLIILDMLMPEMAGNVVAEKIRKNPKTRNQKIVFLTVVTPGEHGKVAIQKLKPVDYIQKPFKNDDFRKRIKKIIGTK